MNVEIGPEAALFPEKEYINGIAVAVYTPQGPELHLEVSTHYRGLCCTWRFYSTGSWDAPGCIYTKSIETCAAPVVSTPQRPEPNSYSMSVNLGNVEWDNKSFHVMGKDAILAIFDTGE